MFPLSISIPLLITSVLSFPFMRSDYGDFFKFSYLELEFQNMQKSTSNIFQSFFSLTPSKYAVKMNTEKIEKILTVGRLPNIDVLFWR